MKGQSRRARDYPQWREQLGNVREKESSHSEVTNQGFEDQFALLDVFPA